MIERITFLLAFFGFAALTCNAVLAAGRRTLRWVSVVTAIIVAAHVYLVWAFRYEFSFAQATRNGYIGFALFHAALAALLVATIAPAPINRWLTIFAFLAVCLGANGAVFRYDVVAAYRFPVIACTMLGGIGAFLELRKNQKRGQP